MFDDKKREITLSKEDLSLIGLSEETQKLVLYAQEIEKAKEIARKRKIIATPVATPVDFYDEFEEKCANIIDNFGEIVIKEIETGPKEVKLFKGEEIKGKTGFGFQRDLFLSAFIDNRNWLKRLVDVGYIDNISPENIKIPRLKELFLLLDFSGLKPCCDVRCKPDEEGIRISLTYEITPEYYNL
jgi:hypothetical protein